MWLSSQKLPDIENVSETDIVRAFHDEAFGKFIILWSSEDRFIQSGFNGARSEKCWTLEYIDDSTDTLYTAADELILEQVKRAFIEYLRGDEGWRQEYTCVEQGRGPSPLPVVTMTESEWLSCTESTEMLGLLGREASERNLRLFMIACCRRIWPLIVDERSRRAVEQAELDVDGHLGMEERFASARAAADALVEAYDNLDIRCNGHLYHAAWAAALCLCTAQIPLRTPIDNPALNGAFDCAMLVAIQSAYAAAISKVNTVDSKTELHAQLEVETDAEYAEQCHLLREIFSYPFDSERTN